MATKNKEYTIKELVDHFRFVQRQAVGLGALFEQEEINKSYAIIDKLQELNDIKEYLEPFRSFNSHNEYIDKLLNIVYKS